jgi:hypothetical protein
MAKHLLEVKIDNLQVITREFETDSLNSMALAVVHVADLLDWRRGQDRPDSPVFSVYVNASFKKSKPAKAVKAG